MEKRVPQRVYYIKAEWDDEAKVWYVSSTDVPGLVAEANTPAELLSLLEVLVPEMIQLNGDDTQTDIPYSVMLDHLKAQRIPA